jgi:hypothetical protein
VEHQGHTAPAHDTAIKDQDQGLEGEMRQQDLDLRDQRALYGDVVIADPPGQALDPTLRLAPIGHFRRDVGELGALAGHNTAAERGQGGHVPGALTLRLTGIPLS